MNIKLDIFGINNTPLNFYGAPTRFDEEKMWQKKENDTREPHATTAMNYDKQRKQRQL